MAAILIHRYTGLGLLGVSMTTTSLDVEFGHETSYPLTLYHPLPHFVKPKTYNFQEKTPRAVHREENASQKSRFYTGTLFFYMTSSRK